MKQLHLWRLGQRVRRFIGTHVDWCLMIYPKRKILQDLVTSSKIQATKYAKIKASDYVAKQKGKLFELVIKDRVGNTVVEDSIALQRPWLNG